MTAEVNTAKDTAAYEETAEDGGPEKLTSETAIIESLSDKEL